MLIRFFYLRHSSGIELVFCLPDSPPSLVCIYRLVNFQTNEPEERKKRKRNEAECLDGDRRPVLFFFLCRSSSKERKEERERERKKTEGRNNRRQLEQMAR